MEISIFLIAKPQDIVMCPLNNLQCSVVWLALQLVQCCHRTFHNRFPCKQSSRHLLECNVSNRHGKQSFFIDQFINLDHLVIRKGHRNSPMTRNFTIATFKILIIERQIIRKLVYECRLLSFRLDQLHHTLIIHQSYISHTYVYTSLL